jgi:hypothetical protein
MIADWVQEMVVWDIIQNKIIYKGNYKAGEDDVRDTKNSDLIYIAYKYFDYGWAHGDADSELMAFAAKNQTLYGVKCQLNLKTMERKILSKF